MYLYRHTSKNISLTRHNPAVHGYASNYVGETLSYVQHEDNFVIVQEPDAQGRAVLYNTKMARYFPAIECKTGEQIQQAHEIAKVWETHVETATYEEFEGACRIFDVVYILDSGPVSLKEWQCQLEQGWNSETIKEAEGVMRLASFPKSESASAILKYLF